MDSKNSVISKHLSKLRRSRMQITSINGRFMTTLQERGQNREVVSGDAYR
jgi:hypothetical protein